MGMLVFAGCERPAGTVSRSKEATAKEEANDEAAVGKLFGSELKRGPQPATSETTAGDLPSRNLSSRAMDSSVTAVAGRLQFVDVAASVGLEFTYDNGAEGRSLMVETVGGGVGALDFDLDGRCDLLFCQGGDPTTSDDALRPPVALFRNTPLATFQDVAAAANLSAYRYGQGVAVGDYDADGFADIYLTCVGRNVLLRNNGDGTFRELPEEICATNERWSTSAAMADLTGNGLLDLYVCNYVRYDPRRPLDCRNSKGEYRICHPREIPAWPDDVYINQGDGRLVEQATQRGLIGDGSKALGVAVADFDVDGRADLYVANDTTANFLFVNQGDGRFQERALLSGCAVNYEGLFQASMGLAIGDYDRNGLLDIYSTHFYEESNTLYRNLGHLGFQDVTGSVGLHSPTLQSLAFGTVMQDFDHDGWQDLFVTNGHVENYADNPILEMRPQAFQFDGLRWREVSDSAGRFFGEKYVGRGVARVDFDNDGDFDLAVVHQNAPAALLRNDAPQENQWLKLSCIGRRSPRDGIGCRVTVIAGETRHVQEIVGGGSYLSSHQPALVFGLGNLDQPCVVEIRWPSGVLQVLQDVQPKQALVIEEPLR